MSSIELEHHHTDNAMVVVVRGDINSSSAPDFGSYLKEAIGHSGNAHIVLDMSGVQYMSSAGLREIVGGLKLAQRAGGNLVIAGLQERLRLVLDISGLPTISKIFDSVEEAVDSFA
jgi:anti-sigma B factor antagonist